MIHLLRHARTAHSATYRVTGRPDAYTPLDEYGRQQCLTARATLPVDRLATCLVSELPRTAQTANLLLGEQAIPVLVDRRLNEIDYGQFEGGPFLTYGRWLRVHGPWQRPPGAAECQREAIKRMLDGLRGALAQPGPRLVIAHGLLLSVVSHTRDGQPLTGAFFPEAPYLAPLTFGEDELCSLTDRLISDINTDQAGQYGPNRGIYADR